MEGLACLLVLCLVDGRLSSFIASMVANDLLSSIAPTPQAGVMALMRVYDSHANYCMLSRARRPSALTVYLPIWHGDVRQFVICRTSRAAPEDRVRHVFPAMWIPDILCVMKTMTEGFCSLT